MYLLAALQAHQVHACHQLGGFHVHFVHLQAAGKHSLDAAAL
jgi:hypothetical protein